MITLRPRIVASLLLAAVPAVALAGPVAASHPAVLPDDLAFLDSPVIDDVVAGAEGGLADCAALSTVMGIAFAASLLSADWDLGDPSDTAPSTEAPATTEVTVTAEAFWAVAAPLLVPLLDRASTDDPAAAAFVEVAGPDLVDAIYELRDKGLTDDDLLLIQESFAVDMLGTEAMGDDGSTPEEPEDSAALAELQQRAEAIVTDDFESITFLDEDAEDMPGMESDALPWEADCPETAGMFDFDMDPVSATIDFEATITIP